MRTLIILAATIAIAWIDPLSKSAATDQWHVTAIEPEVVGATPAGLGFVYIHRQDGTNVVCPDASYGTYVARSPTSSKIAAAAFQYVIPGDPKPGLPLVVYSTKEQPLVVACLKVSR